MYMYIHVLCVDPSPAFVSRSSQTIYVGFFVVPAFSSRKAQLKEHVLFEKPLAKIHRHYRVLIREVK